MGKLFVLGIDGLSFDQWHQLIELGAMPNSKALIGESDFRRMNSSLPEVSSTAWSSIVTGKTPAEHNIYGFTDIIDGSYTLGFTSAKTRKADPFWLKPDSGRSLIMNVPQTFPASEIKGFLVAGYVALDLKRSVYPTDELSYLQEKGYQIDVDMSLVRESKDDFLNQLHAVMETRYSVLKEKLAKEKWDSVMFVVTGTDRLCHYYWDQWQDPSSTYYERYVDYYKRVDEIIGEIAGELRQDDTLIMVSDHGFEEQKEVLNLNKVLHEAGYLKVEPSERLNYGSMTDDSLAFCMDPGRIYLHRKDRFPNGSVEASHIEPLLDELSGLFSEYAFDGTPVVRDIYRGADIYSGTYAHRAPDLVLLSNPGFAFSGRMQLDSLTEESNINGKHRYDDAIFLYRGPEKIDIPEIVEVENVLRYVEVAAGRDYS